ncbi:hypothetical protein [Thioalkalivibrio sp. HK1]|uniref:hypothetical protein n=1 Tax=Thioalkalivibrio sp. HK1 TaxID=1469245 RepID=UPI000472BEDE|nr:hypothetical protein [Thioalkalivibrio sp. HK1]
MYRYDLLLLDTKTGIGNWVVGFEVLEAAKGCADQLQSALEDENTVCTLYARTEEGDLYRHQNDGFFPVPDHESVKYRYLVILENGTIDRDFGDRQMAQDFINSHPRRSLRLRARRVDGISAPSQSPSMPGGHDFLRLLRRLRSPKDPVFIPPSQYSASAKASRRGLSGRRSSRRGEMSNPDLVKHPYLVISEGGFAVGGVFEDRRSAKDFIDSHPGQRLRLRIAPIDNGLAAASQSPSTARSAVNPKPSKGFDRPDTEDRPQGQKISDDRQPDDKEVTSSLVDSASPGIGSEGVGYRYLVVSKKDSVIIRDFANRQSARDFIDDRPDLLLLLCVVQRADGVVAPSQNIPSAKSAGQAPSDSGERHRERTRPDGPQSEGKRISPLLAGAAGFGIGALAANAARAKSTGEGGSSEVATLAALSALGGDEGAAVDAAFVNSAGKGVSAELAALTALSAYAAGDEGMSADPFAAGGLPSEDPPFAGEGFSSDGFEDDHSTGDAGDDGNFY